MKTLTMYRPNTVQNALNDFDRYFESFFGDSLLPSAARMLNQLPAVDIRETEGAYILDMDLPGFDEKDIEVHVDGSSLTIASKQEEVNETKDKGKDTEGKKTDGTFIMRERRINSFSRSFKLPENADPESVKAVFKNGILTMEIKKRPEAQKKTIQINAS
jgi:HSP20 family protein